ncbi:acyl-CoA dehydrogenase family protein, partial [Rossellomorea marisflavi]|uniref:acyl-CoA dehydrogenase family protein n=1 Tax=Rossellomorea marisflavi TaxID=189381 RepID=UPI003513BDDD
MNFDLTQEQTMIKKTIREFADEEVAPGALERDRSKQFPADVFKKLADLGL